MAFNSDCPLRFHCIVLLYTYYVLCISLSVVFQECTDPCCDARTCRLVTGAQCHKGECCSSQCRFKDSSSVCRSAVGECDIEDRCSGLSSDCPADTYAQDGTSCSNNQSYCFSGQCKLYNEQCQRHFQTSMYNICALH